jgi:periplasmic divalent cation tolerance protein
MARRAPAARDTPRTGAGGRVRVLWTTVPPRAAGRIARTLVEEGVAACVSAVPGVLSVYRWKGRIEAAKETLLLLKTTAAAASRCRAALVRLHPYEVPEILEGSPGRADAAYGAWVRASVRVPDAPARVR